LIPSSFATLAIGRDVSITIFTASSLNSGEKLFFGRGNYFTFPDGPSYWTACPEGPGHLTRAVRCLEAWSGAGSRTGCRWRVYLVIFVVIFVVAVLLPVRGPGVTLVMVAWSRRVPVLALTVTVVWMRQAAPALRVARWHCTVARRAPVCGVVQCPRPAVAERNVVPAGRWPPSLSCHAADGPWSVIVMVQVSAEPCWAVAGAVTLAARPA
jgi:hypothetical protein